MSAHVDIVCANCGVEFCMPAHLNDQHRRKHSTFYCPNGHSNYYPQKTEQEKTIERLRKVIASSGDRFAELAEERDDWKMHARTCPFECGFRVLRVWKPESISARMTAHLIEEHGARFDRVLAIPSKTGSAS